MPQVLKEANPSPMKLEVLNAEDWPLIVDPEGVHDKQYDDTETSLIVEGSGEIVNEGYENVVVTEGDLITILPGTRCQWHITKEIRRHCAKG